MSDKRRIKAAAEMAGNWWADRLNSMYADKREAFAQAVATRVEKALHERGRVFTEVDYDPQDLMLEAVREAVSPECKGVWFSARGILPQKHSLDVSAKWLKPKEGYGNWTADIPVRAAASTATEVKAEPVRNEGGGNHE